MDLRSIFLSALLLIVGAIGFRAVHTKIASISLPFKEPPGVSKEIDQARRIAQANHKYFMVEFGAEWCSDCLALSRSLDQQPLRDYVQGHFTVFPIDVGEFNRNLEIAKSFGIDINRGIPSAVFYPPNGATPSREYGTNQILAFVKNTAEQH